MSRGYQSLNFACAAIAALFVCGGGSLGKASAQTAAPNPPRPTTQAEPSTQARTPPAQAPARTPAEVQSTPPTRPDDARATNTATDAPSRAADLAITARVTARELKFNIVPNPRVEFTGRPHRETVWEAERQNLPQSVRPGETYRDIGITLRITSVFADIDRIVAEALGEIPLSEDAPPPSPQPPSPAPPAAPPL